MGEGRLAMSSVAAVCVLLAASSAPAQDGTVGVRLREWQAKLDGRVQAQVEGSFAADVDLDSTLGIDDPDLVHEIQAYLSLPLLGTLTAGWWSGTWDGDEFVSQDFTFGDTTFTAGTTVRSELELDVYSLSFEFGLPSLPLGPLALDLGILVGARAIHADGEVEAAGESAQDSGTVALPVLGVRGALEMTDWLRAEIEVAGLTFRHGDSSGLYIEAYGEVVGRIGPFFAGVGYKFVDLDMADHRSGSDFDLEIDVSGFYLTAGVGF
jgi:hypothetical protein